MAGTQNIPLGQAKDVVRNVISFINIADIDVNNIEDSVEADILKEYIKNDNFEKALRSVCTDNDIQTLASYSTDATWEINYEVNGADIELATDDEIRLFWSVISSDELLKQSIVHFQNAI